jgi:anti-sigma regulatory factor (Ser/Thr protein kinase)
VTELVINVNKYAYAGEPGPIEITLTGDHARFRLVVADKGRDAPRHARDLEPG